MISNSLSLAGGSHFSTLVPVTNQNKTTNSYLPIQMKYHSVFAKVMITLMNQLESEPINLKHK